MPSTLSSVENVDKKNRQSNLSRQFHAFTDRLKRKKTANETATRSNSVLSSYQSNEADENRWNSKVGDSSTLPPRSSINSSQGLTAKRHAVTSESVEFGYSTSSTLPAGSMIEARKMIAPANPPPPIPSMGSNGAMPFLTKRTLSVTTNEPANNGLKQVNGQQPLKQNGTAPQPPPHAPSVAAQKPMAKESEEKTQANGTTGKKSELLELPKYPNVKLNGFVGFASLPYQVVRRCQQRGFQFNLLCVGETGTGKTTLIESLFGIKLDDFEPCGNELNTVELRSKQCEITDSNVNVKLRIVETAGSNKCIAFSAKVIVDYINSQFEARLKEELMVKRCLSYYDDKRIHACLYFISPTGHGLKALDVVTMKELSKRVNVIPVIAKSDTTSKDELARFKSKILTELRNHNIEIYQFPTDDEAVAEQNRRMNSFVPFAVVGSIDFVTKEDGSTVRARRYPWGIVEAVLRTNVDALRERTHKILYESYRRERLRQLKMNDFDTGSNFETAIECRQEEFKRELEKRDKQFSEKFVQRVDAKEIELKRRDEMLTLHKRDMESSFKHSMQELEDRIEQMLEEKARLEGRSSNRGSSKSRK
ncbi:Septin-type G domain-containing protein [Aphelenchoides besseyi]|nr:Septin-type G domain-containing protein [Aphelenchoides besseyi]